MTQDVDPAIVAEAGRVYGKVYDAAAAAVHHLSGVLKGSAGMGGTDNAGHSWSLKYDALVGGRAGGAGLMEAATATIMGAAQCSDLLATTAVNHQNADQQSAMNNAGAPAFPPTAKPMFLVPAIPSAEGGHDDVPGWWHTIQAYVQGEMWPNGHQDKLRAAADAWHTAARELRSAADIANDGVIESVRAQKSPEFPVAATPTAPWRAIRSKPSPRGLMPRARRVRTTRKQSMTRTRRSCTRWRCSGRLSQLPRSLRRS